MLNWEKKDAEPEKRPFELFYFRLKSGQLKSPGMFAGWCFLNAFGNFNHQFFSLIFPFQWFINSHEQNICCFIRL